MAVLGQAWERNFEELIASEMRRYGPFVAIGRPDESLPPLGAAREYVDGATWQERVHHLATEARLVVLIIGQTQGLEWEFRRLREMGALDRTLLVVPPTATEDVRSRWRTLRLFLAALAEIEVPESQLVETALIATFNKGTLVLITGQYRRDPFYREAFRRAAQLAAA